VRVNVGQAKTNLSELLARAEAGEEIEIARNGVPVARLSRVERPQRPGERFRAMKGALAGRVFLADDVEFTDVEIDEMLEEDPYHP
jgi:prevent-host-death family protein